MSHLYEVIATAVIQLAIAAFVYGRLTERVAGHRDKLNEHAADITTLQLDVKDHEHRITKLEATQGD